MQTLTDNATPILIDYRELREQLPNAKDDDLATEFNTGRMVALVEDASGCGYDERRLPMAYDETKDAWSICRTEARRGRYLFRQTDVDELASRHPEWLPQPVLPVPCHEPELQPLAQALPVVLELEQNRIWLEAELAKASEELARQKREVEEARALVAETVKLRQYQAWSEKAVAAMSEAMEAQKSRIDELETELAKAQETACIGDGVVKLACDLKRKGLHRDTIAAKLYECPYKPSYGVIRCLVSTPSELKGDVKFPAEGNDAVSNRRTGSGKTMVKNGREKLDRPC